MHRVITMWDGLLASENKRASVHVTVSVFDADERRLHKSFRLKKWTGRDGDTMVTADLNDADWGAGRYATQVAHCNVNKGEVWAVGKDSLLAYAAKAAFQYVQTGTVPNPANGRVECVESDRCGMCGAELRDPVSIERGIGPECFGKETGSKTIRSRSKATKAEKELQASKNGSKPKSDQPSSQLTTLPGETWADIFKKGA